MILIFKSSPSLTSIFDVSAWWMWSRRTMSVTEKKKKKKESDSSSIRLWYRYWNWKRYWYTYIELDIDIDPLSRHWERISEMIYCPSLLELQQSLLQFRLKVYYIEIESNSWKWFISLWHKLYISKSLRVNLTCPAECRNASKEAWKSV